MASFCVTLYEVELLSPTSENSKIVKGLITFI